VATVISREVYFETGLEVLSELGYGGLKLAEVCNRLGVTTGSFYHYFTSWPIYTNELVAHWMNTRTNRLVESLRAEPDSRRRIDKIVEIGQWLPHGAEAAIRAWGSVDRAVRAVQAQVDRQRFDFMYESAFDILHDERNAELFASWATYVLVGYEQALLPSDSEAFAWAADRLIDALYSGRFASAPAE
jgi:AcrR family transcriptional regulator